MGDFMNLRVRYEKIEHEILSEFASFADESLGREIFEEPCEIRTCFCKYRDRIIHSKAFRRLKHKTQVFLSPTGDHYRTRLTHTLEVSQIARTIARALRLNEDLTEAIAIGHDLGHTPFGHAGEYSLRKVLPNGFNHNEQSIRVVKTLERYPRGLNLTKEVLDGILNHVGKNMPSTLEGKIVRFSDKIAYINHDIDDAIRAGILSEDDLPKDVVKILGDKKSKRINTLIFAIINASQNKNEIIMTDKEYSAMEILHKFMFEKVYTGSKAKLEEDKAMDLIINLFKYYKSNPDKLPNEYKDIIKNESVDRAVCDYIASMSDIYILNHYKEIFIPKGWEY